MACALCGAVAGNAVGSGPVLHRAVFSSFEETQASGPPADQTHALPNHYPMATRGGVVPVELLSERGLFSQARYRLSSQGQDEMRDIAPEAPPDSGNQWPEAAEAPEPEAMTVAAQSADIQPEEDSPEPVLAMR